MKNRQQSRCIVIGSWLDLLAIVHTAAWLSHRHLTLLPRHLLPDTAHANSTAKSSRKEMWYWQAVLGHWNWNQLLWLYAPHPQWPDASDVTSKLGVPLEGKLPLHSNGRQMPSPTADQAGSACSGGNCNTPATVYHIYFNSKECNAVAWPFQFVHCQRYPQFPAGPNCQAQNMTTHIRLWRPYYTKSSM